MCIYHTFQHEVQSRAKDEEESKDYPFVQSQDVEQIKKRGEFPTHGDTYEVTPGVDESKNDESFEDTFEKKKF